ncbi:root phototropism protein 3-like isoform X2 [Abrus precatorius]|uniref:Root phototropism protein 3-like isoform X2 n=1 Tax=Abrus precatorius TaxID=3816 RepID=A0A8B8MFC9_ABRPR|nr:root phototropism protein 3-like isoform X2 [Abrus precatorius]
MGSKSVDPESALGGTVVYGGNCNHCVLLPASVPILAHSLERRKQNWIARANSPTDLIIQVGDSSFHLHKLAMVSRSEYLNRLVFERGSHRESGRDSLNIEIKNLPGGTKTFALVVKFCYGWKIDITPTNIIPLYCAAHFLEMSEDLEEGNLISKTEAFLNFLILSSWKDTFRILKSCESISPWAKDLQIMKRCSEAIAWKACAIPNASSRIKNMADTWWFQDVSLLRIDHFIEVIQSIKKHSIKQEIVGSCIEHWTRKWFSHVKLGIDKVATKQITLQLHRVSIECLIRILPGEENSVTCTFLLHLIKAGVMLKINSELLCALERRVALMLEKCRVQDLLVKNQGHSDSLYDVTVVLRVLRFSVCGMSSNSSAKLHAVGKLVDGYLTQVARDENLPVENFKALVQALPQHARYCDDNLYRAIDMYLKAHPDLTEEDRMDVCRVLEYHRLSQEARQHVMKNDRLPFKLVTEFVLLEQVNVARSMSSNGSNYQRTNTQTIIRVNKDFEKRQINVHEIKMMRNDVEIIKSQLLELNSCKIKLQKQLMGCIR